MQLLKYILLFLTLLTLSLCAPNKKEFKKLVLEKNDLGYELILNNEKILKQGYSTNPDSIIDYYISEKFITVLYKTKSGVKLDALSKYSNGEWFPEYIQLPLGFITGTTAKIVEKVVISDGSNLSVEYSICGNEKMSKKLYGFQNDYKTNIVITSNGIFDKKANRFIARKFNAENMNFNRPEMEIVENNFNNSRQMPEHQ